MHQLSNRLLVFVFFLNNVFIISLYYFNVLGQKWPSKFSTGHFSSIKCLWTLKSKVYIICRFKRSRYQKTRKMTVLLFVHVTSISRKYVPKSFVRKTDNHGFELRKNNMNHLEFQSQLVISVTSKR